MEAVCCCVRKQVTSLSLFFLAPLWVSPSLFFSSPTSTLLSVYPWHSLSVFFSLSLLLPPRRHPRLSPPESRPSEPDKNSVPAQVCVCVCVYECVCAYVSPSIDEIWAVKYECWVMFRCHVVTSLTRGGVVKMVMHTWRWLSVFDK